MVVVGIIGGGVLLCPTTWCPWWEWQPRLWGWAEDRAPCAKPRSLCHQDRWTSAGPHDWKDCAFYRKATFCFSCIHLCWRVSVAYSQYCSLKLCAGADMPSDGAQALFDQLAAQPALMLLCTVKDGSWVLTVIILKSFETVLSALEWTWRCVAGTPRPRQRRLKWGKQVE